MRRMSEDWRASGRLSMKRWEGQFVNGIFMQRLIHCFNTTNPASNEIMRLTYMHKEERKIPVGGSTLVDGSVDKSIGMVELLRVSRIARRRTVDC